MLLHCFLCLIAVMSFFREWDDRSFRRWGWGWECWAVASSTLSSFSGSAPSTSSASASSLVASSWEDRWRASLCTFWLNVMRWYFWDQASLSGQVLPNRTECGDGQGCNQPPAVFQKAVILLIGDFFKFSLFPMSIQMPWNMTFACTMRACSARSHIRCPISDANHCQWDDRYICHLGFHHIYLLHQLPLSEQAASAADLVKTWPHVWSCSWEAFQVRA